MDKTVTFSPQLAMPAYFGLAGELQWRSLGPEYFEQWLSLRNVVLQALDEPDCYVREKDEKAFFLQHSPPLGQCIGVFQGNDLVAYAMVGLPSAIAPDNLARIAGLPAQMHHRVAHLASCMVHPAWRGHHLQALLLRIRFAVAQAWGRSHCLAMVSLRNDASRHNLLSQGLSIIWTGWIDGLQRHVMAVNLRATANEPPTTKDVWCGSQDFEQLRLLSSMGMHGVGELRVPEGVRLRFVPFTAMNETDHCGEPI